MSNSYLLLPERLARFPITLEEAAFKFGVGNLPAIDRASLSLERRMKYGYYSRRAVLLNLMGGDLHAFVQDASIGAWYRIPKAYWLGDGVDVATAMERPHLPELLEHRFSLVTPDDGSIVGQPIVVWQDDVERLVEVMGVLGAAMNVPNQPENVATADERAAPDPDAAPSFTKDTGWSEISAWYLRHVSEAPAVGLTRDEDRAAASAVGISRDRWRALRKELAPEHWSKDGRKPH